MKKFKKSFLAALLVLATVGVYSMHSKNALTATEMFALPDIYAIGPSGPQQNFGTDLFIDFHDSPGPSYHPGVQFVWSSTPPIPGMTSAGSSSLMKTVYIPTSTPSGSYLVKATNPNTGEFTAVNFTINGNGSSGSGGGPGGGIIKTE